MTRLATLVLLAAVLYSAFLYSVHLLVDNAGADVGTAARVVYKLREDPSFIFGIKQDRVKHGLDSTLTEDEKLRNDAYACGPKFAAYGIAAGVFSLGSLAWAGIDPLSALFFTNLAFFFASVSLIVFILKRSGSFDKWTFAFIAPALFLSMPSVYYLVFYPTYLFMLTFLLLLAVYIVMRSCGNNRCSTAGLFVSGAALGLTAGTGAQAVVCIFAGAVFTALYAFPKRLFLKSLLVQSLGIIAAIALAELAFQLNGSSFLKWTWLHTRENVYDNHLKAPFPFILFVYPRMLYALVPLTLAAFTAGLLLSKLWWKHLTDAGRSLLASLLVTVSVLSFLPNTPLFRVFFPFFVVMQIIVFMMVLNIKVKAVRYALVALLLVETALSLPAAMFIRLGPTENNSPVQVFEDERKILRYFDQQGIKAQAGGENLLSLREFVTTETDERPMAPAASIGSRRSPKKGHRAPAATGMRTAL